MNKSDSVAELAKALSIAQGAMKGAKKDSENPFFKSRYADLESVWDACRDVLSDCGLSVMQTIGSQGNMPSLTTTLLHSSGEWISDTAILTPKSNSPQDTIACVTYFRRAALAALVGVVQTDDDGETAMARATTTSPPQGASNSVLSKPSLAAPAGGSNIHTCGNVMMVSKYEPNTYYCGKCKQKVPMEAKPAEKGPLFDDDIPPFEPPGYMK